MALLLGPLATAAGTPVAACSADPAGLVPHASGLMIYAIAAELKAMRIPNAFALDELAKGVDSGSAKTGYGGYSAVPMSRRPATSLTEGVAGRTACWACSLNTS